MSDFIQLTVVDTDRKSYVRHSLIVEMMRSRDDRYTVLKLRGCRSAYNHVYNETPDQIAEKIREVTRGLR